MKPVAPRGRLAILALVTAIATGGCRTARALIATPEDYAAYRPVRTLPTLEERLRAAEAYLAAHPDGAFAHDARRFFTRAEEAYFASKRGSAAGLTAYLELLPRGPHAEAARRTLLDKQAAAIDLLGDRARGTEARLATAAGARAAAREELTRWAARFADAAVFDARLEEAPAGLVVAWSLSLPAPRCEPGADGRARTCTKLVTRAFAMPGKSDGSTTSDAARELVIEIRVVEDADGDVCSVAIAGPSMFSRWEEASSLEPAEVGEARAQAVRSAAAMVRSTFETRASGCGEVEGEPAGRFVCGPLRVAVVAGQGAGADDVVTISKASSCPSP